MSSILYGSDCDINAGSHNCDQCSGSEGGRLRFAAAVHLDYESTLRGSPAVRSVWETGVANGLIILIGSVRGTISGTKKYKPGTGNVKEKYTGTDFKASIVDPVWFGNHTFYSNLQESQNYHFVWAAERYAQMSTNPAVWKPDEPLEEGLDTDREWKIDVEFTQRPFSTPFLYPTNIFRCVSLGV